MKKKKSKKVVGAAITFITLGVLSVVGYSFLHNGDLYYSDIVLVGIGQSFLNMMTFSGLAGPQLYVIIGVIALFAFLVIDLLFIILRKRLGRIFGLILSAIFVVCIGGYAIWAVASPLQIIKTDGRIYVFENALDIFERLKLYIDANTEGFSFLDYAIYIGGHAFLLLGVFIAFCLVLSHMFNSMKKKTDSKSEE